jgi:bacteriorhodopsin
MKLATFFAVAAIASAQDGDASQAADTTQGAADTTQADAYGSEQTEAYGQEAYAAPYAGAYMRAPEVCLGGCPEEAPCQSSASGACVQKIQHYAAPAYEAHYAPTEEYGASQEQAQGYRRLEDGGCPVGTFDTSCGILKSRVVLWIAFALLFIPAIYFFCIDPSSWSTQKSKGIQYKDQAVYFTTTEDYQLHKTVAGCVVFIASLAYLTMALGYGSTIRCCDGREFFYARYIDWTITTPLMLWEIMSLSNALYHERVFVYCIDIIMIIGGLIGALVCGGEKWAFFGFSILTFIPVLTYLCYVRRRYTYYDDKIFKGIVNITVLTWFFYPVVWILAEGTGVLCAQGEAICYTVLDIISKSLFGFILVNNPFAFSTTEEPVNGDGPAVINNSML